MKIEKIKLVKSLKMALLLVSSLLIATASAYIYSTLTMQSQITISALVHFTSGSDTTSESTVQNTYCSLQLSCYPNATTTYQEAVNISNTDSAAHEIKLRHVSISGNGTSDVGNFTYITFYLLDSSGAQKAYLNYTTSGDYWFVSPTETTYQSIPANTEWIVKVVIVTAETASTDISCTIKIALDVR